MLKHFGIFEHVRTNQKVWHPSKRYALREVCTVMIRQWFAVSMRVWHLYKNCPQLIFWYSFNTTNNCKYPRLHGRKGTFEMASDTFLMKILFQHRWTEFKINTFAPGTSLSSKTIVSKFNLRHRNVFSHHVSDQYLPFVQHGPKTSAFNIWETSICLLIVMLKVRIGNGNFREAKAQNSTNPQAFGKPQRAQPKFLHNMFPSTWCLSSVLREVDACALYWRIPSEISISANNKY